MSKYFTLEEANNALETLRPLVARLMELREQILESKPAAWPVIEKAAGNGGSKASSILAMEFEQINRLVKQIQGTGAELKDLNNGLVDFPSLRDGREVYLCWRYGEDTIAFWHDLDTGFNGRQPI